MKRCSTCKIERPLTEFNKNRSKKDGLQSRCRSCDTEIGKAWYRKNKSVTNERNERYRERNRNWVRSYLSEHPCPCGEDDPVVMEFHHHGEDKTANVSFLVRGSYSLARIQEEVAKCVVLCANCHRRETAKQFGWWARGEVAETVQALV